MGRKLTGRVVLFLQRTTGAPLTTMELGDRSVTLAHSNDLLCGIVYGRSVGTLTALGFDGGLMSRASDASFGRAAAAAVLSEFNDKYGPSWPPSSGNGGASTGGGGLVQTLEDQTSFSDILGPTLRYQATQEMLCEL